jgi:cytochrome c oxidase assembly protein subunit 11
MNSFPSCLAYTPQCFYYKAGEEIDMPVFFFLDSEMLEDPAMDNVNNITLSYTFFKSD